jgi:pimeloyl-ACP methyl ester carboxylesterase
VVKRVVHNDGVDLCVETFGDPADATILLISGLTASMDWWDEEFCTRLADEQRQVIRYDHRDTGESTNSPAGRPSYTGHDLATDPLRVLDACDVTTAHLVGVSAGGAMAQVVAAHHPQRVLTLTLIATSPAGERSSSKDPLPRAEPRVAKTFEEPAPDPSWDDRDAVVEYLVEGERPYAGTLGFDAERVRTKATAVVARTVDIAASVANHWLADEDPADRFRMSDISVPTLVLHGTDDPMFPIAHGEALAAEIPGARLVPLAGMGHEVPPPQLWDVVIREVVEHTG